MGLRKRSQRRCRDLNATQTSLSIVAGNVANAQTPGYVAQSAVKSKHRPATSATAYGSPRSTALSTVRPAAIVDGKRWRWLRRPASPVFISSCSRSTASPAPAPRSTIRFNNFTSAVQALSTSPSSDRAQSQTRQRRASAGAAAQQRDNRHPDAAHPSRPGHRQRCADGQQRPAADCANQSATVSDDARTTARPRHARGPARSVHQPALKTDGHARHPR